MADIKKTLLLGVKLDDSAFKSQMQALKKELGQGFSIKPSDLNELKAAFRSIAKEFSEELRGVISELKGLKGAPMATSGPQGPAGRGSQPAQPDEGGGPERRPTPRLGRGMAAGAAGVVGIYGAVQSFRETLAEREFRSLQDQAQGKFLEDIARQSGRQALMPKLIGGGAGLLGGIGAGALTGGAFGSIVPGIGNVAGMIGGGIIGGIGGAFGGGLLGSQREGELNVAKIRPLIQAFEEARALSPSRLSAYSGAGVEPLFLNNAMRTGAGMGFGPQETMRQFLQARGTLGNRQALSSLDQLQEQERFYNVDVGTGARSISALGFASGRGGAFSQSIQESIIKRGVASGLDLSKSGQFLRTVADFAVEQAGTGRVDVERISMQLAGYAKGLGGGQVTDESLEQARRIAETVGREGTSTSGISGLGNIIGMQQAFKDAGVPMTTEAFLAVQNLGPNATNEDISKALSQYGGIAPGEQRDKLAQSIAGYKQNVGNIGAGQFGGIGELLLDRERGLRTEQGFGFREAQGTSITPRDMDMAEFYTNQARNNVTGTPEYKLAQAEASRATESSIAGFERFDLGIARATSGLDELQKALTLTNQRLMEMAGKLGILRTN